MSTAKPVTSPRGFVATVILGALATSLSTVSAADDPHPVSITVKYADLNVASPSGARALYARIRAAAQNACSYYWFKTDADEFRCLHNTIARAVSKVNQPALSALLDEEYKSAGPSPLVSQSR